MAPYFRDHNFSTATRFYIPQPPSLEADSVPSTGNIEAYYVWNSLSVPSCNPEDGFKCGAHRADSECCETSNNQSMDAFEAREIFDYFKDTVQNKSHLMPCFRSIRGAREERDRLIKLYPGVAVEIARISISAESYYITKTHLELLRSCAHNRVSPGGICFVKETLLAPGIFFLWGDIHPDNILDGWADLVLPPPMYNIPEDPLSAPRRMYTVEDFFKAAEMSDSNWEPDPALRTFMRRFEEKLIAKEKAEKEKGEDKPEKD